MNYLSKKYQNVTVVDHEIFIFQKEKYMAYLEEMEQEKLQS